MIASRQTPSATRSSAPEAQRPHDAIDAAPPMSGNETDAAASGGQGRTFDIVPRSQGSTASVVSATRLSRFLDEVMFRFLPAVFWWILSVGLFAGLWEGAWALGWINPLLLPPPHVFLQNFILQGRFFSQATRMGNVPLSAIAMSVATTTGITAIRVLVGLLIGFVISLAVGVLIRSVRLFGNLTLPMVTLLTPISPVAWLPVAIFAFGIGNAAAVFLVFIALFFIMTLATITEIDQVKPAYLNVARNMGANRRQLLLYVILPAILPGLFLVLRLNLFAAWMTVLIGEAIGVSSGLGQVVMLARNTFNSSLTFFTMTIIGIVGYALDVVLLQIQRRLLYWVPQEIG
jgi:NitT/TauT family transport system permease protein